MTAPIKIGSPEFKKLEYEWNKKLAQCPHRPACKRGKCDVAIPLDTGMSIFERGGSGGSGETRDITYVQLDGIDHLTGEPVADRLFAESAALYGAPSIADTPDGTLWRTVNQKVAQLPLNYKGRRLLEVFADTACIQTAMDATGKTRRQARTIIDRFCAVHEIDRTRLLRRK